jgi:hypothetical protein
LTGTEPPAGVTAIETNAGLIATFVCVLMLPELAVMTAAPMATLVAKPEALTVVMLESDELHVTELVRFDVLPSEYVPVAVNCCVVPITIEGLAGVIAKDARLRGEVVVPELPHPAILNVRAVAMKNAIARRIWVLD